MIVAGKGQADKLAQSITSKTLTFQLRECTGSRIR